MAGLEVDGDDLVLRLSRLEKLGALHGDIRVPRSSVRAVTVSDEPWKTLRGIRAPGSAWPRLIMLGTTRGWRWKDFNAVYRNRPAVVVELDGGGFARFVVASDDADAVAAGLRTHVG